MDRKHLVIVAIYFPPIISIASQRILAFTRYFDRKFFKITLITLDTGEVWEKPGFLQDVEIIRLKNDTALKPVNLRKNYPFLVHKAGAAINKIMDLTIMDEYAGWTKNAARTLGQLHKQHGVDILLSSFAPVASHLAVLKTSLPEHGVKWIADMRDEMSPNPSFSPVKKKYLARIEKMILRNAWLLTTTSDMVQESFQRLDKTKRFPIIQIKNGFDFDYPEDYTYNEVFTITHAGTFYGDIKPTVFFRALSEMLHEKQLPDIRINLIGAGNAVLIPKDLRNYVHITGKIPHDKAVEYIMRSDANLVILPKSRKGAISGKIYEYMASLKPIVAIMDETEQAAMIIRRANAGFVAGLDDIEGIKEAIMKAYDLWARHEKPEVDLAYLNQYHRKHQVKILQDLILKNPDMK